MKPMRLMDRPEDYSRLNVQPQKVAPWEDGRRDTSRPGAFEWWYFDAILDDGTKVVSVFMPKHRENLAHDGDLPHVHLQLTLPDGTQHVEAFQYRADEASFRKEACDVKIGAHHFAGDLQTYSVKVTARWRPKSGVESAAAVSKWQSAIRTTKVSVRTGGLPVKLRGRAQAPDWSRGRTLYSRARGDTTAHHGPLQRLLDVTALQPPWIRQPNRYGV